MGEEPNNIGPWRKVLLLGSGGFGVVSLWRNEETSEAIAVKKCRWSIPSQIPDKQKERWIQEVEIMRGIDHDNIVRFKPLDEEFASALNRYNLSRLPLLSMEYCTKGNLRRALKFPKNSCGLSESEVRYFLKDLNGAISYLHLRKITHRDIKPENVVLQQTDSRPNRIVYKLIDLGYAKELSSVVASFVGTLHYLAPEIFIRDNYSCNVDYWSYGILVFEVICGIHPFMLNSRLSPVERFNYIEKKGDNHICIYSTRSGEIKYSDEIFKENHLSDVFKHHLEEWLRVVLRYDPEKRGKFENGNRTVFEKLDEILNKNIVRVFSLWSMKYIYYEVDEATLVRTLQEWIERDVKVAVEDQLLLMENTYYEDDPDRKVLQCFDEINNETTIYLFKKRNYVAKEEAKLPPIIKNLIRNDKTYCWDELYHQISSSVHYLLSETNLMISLKKSMEMKFHYTKNLLKRQRNVYKNLNESAKKLLNDIELYKDLQVELQEVLANQANADNFRTYRKLLWQCRELLENVNAADARHEKLLQMDKVLQKSYRNVAEKLSQYKPEEIYKKGFELMAISKQSLNEQCKLSSRDISGVIFNYLKERNALVNDEEVEVYLMASFKILREIHRLIKWMTALDLQVKKLCVGIKAIQVEMFKNISLKKGKIGGEFDEEFDTDELLEANMDLRYQNQDMFSLLMMSFEKMKM